MTNKQIKRHKFLTDNEYAKLGAVTNNTIVQVASIVEPFWRKHNSIKWNFLRTNSKRFIRPNQKRNQTALPVLTENLIRHIDKQKVLDLYCLSPTLQVGY